MNQYIITEDGFNELDAYFFEQKDPGVTTLWINLKNKEFQRYNPQAERDKVLDRLDKEIEIRENEMNRKGGFEENLVTASGYYASAGAFNWVRVVLIAGLRTPAPEQKSHCDKCDHWDICEGCPYTDERTPAPEEP